jgi:hypothetical protein
MALTFREFDSRALAAAAARSACSTARALPKNNVGLDVSPEAQSYTMSSDELTFGRIVVLGDTRLAGSGGGRSSLARPSPPPSSGQSDNFGHRSSI